MEAAGRLDEEEFWISVSMVVPPPDGISIILRTIHRQAPKGIADVSFGVTAPQENSWYWTSAVSLSLVSMWTEASSGRRSGCVDKFFKHFRKFPWPYGFHIDMLNFVSSFSGSYTTI